MHDIFSQSVFVIVLFLAVRLEAKSNMMVIFMYLGAMQLLNDDKRSSENDLRLILLIIPGARSKNQFNFLSKIIDKLLRVRHKRIN